MLKTMAAPASKRVLIIGAGPTGLMAALWLTRLNTPLRIIDKHPHSATTSRATVVHARTLEHYQQLGLSSHAVSKGHIVQEFQFNFNRKRIAGRAYGAIGKGRSPFPYILAFPQDLNETMLIDELKRRGVEVEREVECTSLSQSPEKEVATATLRKKSGEEEEFDAAYVLGCDGGWSTVREHTGIKLQAGTYPQRFFVADVQGEVDAELGKINACFNRQDFCIMWGMPDGGFRLIGWAPEPSTSLDENGQPRQPRFEDVEASVVQNTGAKVTKVNWFSTYKVRHGVVDRFRDDRVFLCGDAAHVHSPVGGQGMNTGLGDAINISWKVAAVLAGKAKPEILESYSEERLPFAQTLVNYNDRAFAVMTNKGWLGKLYRSFVLVWLVPWIFSLRSFDAVFFDTLSQTRIEYRASRLSGGKDKNVGTLCAGDRLPWVQFDDGEDNYAPLQSLNWQIHVYGKASGEVKEWAAEKGVEVVEFAFNNMAREKGFMEDGVVLVRPDGYVGLVAKAGSAGDVADLQAFVDKWGIGAF